MLISVSLIIVTTKMLSVIIWTYHKFMAQFPMWGPMDNEDKVCNFLSLNKLNLFNFCFVSFWFFFLYFSSFS